MIQGTVQMGVEGALTANVRKARWSKYMGAPGAVNVWRSPMTVTAVGVRSAR